MASGATAHPLVFSRWVAEERRLPAAEVDGYFGEVADRILLFAFETNRLEVETHSGHLSVKLVARGAERYHVHGRSVLIQPGDILVLRAGERYGSTVEERGTRSVSFFLPPREVAETVASIVARDELVEETCAGEVAEGVVQAPFRARGALARAVALLLAATARPERPATDVLDELVRHVAAGALAHAMRLAPPGALRACARRSTREELISRVLRAREFVHDRHGHATLDEMARVACLSRFHFLRAFTEVVGKSPAEYARGRRLERAADALVRGVPAPRAARAAGFSTTSSLYRALRLQARVEPHGSAARCLARRRQVIVVGDVTPEANSDVS
jgi:AraC family transcriptional regulator